MVISKKAQITIFFLIGIVMMILFSAVLIYRNYVTVAKAPKISNFIGSDRAAEVAGTEIETLVSKELIGLDSISEPIAFSLKSKDSKSVIEDINTPLFFYSGISRIPTKEQLEAMISNYVKQQLIEKDIEDSIGQTEDCKTNKANKENLKVITSISSEAISITVSGLRFYCADRIGEITPSTTVIQGRLSEMLEASDKIARKQIGNKETIDVTYVTDVCADRGFKCVIVPLDENTLVYSISDPDSEIPPLTFGGRL